jgi:hypothetical protein
MEIIRQRKAEYPGMIDYHDNDCERSQEIETWLAAAMLEPRIDLFDCRLRSRVILGTG